MNILPVFVALSQVALHCHGEYQFDKDHALIEGLLKSYDKNIIPVKVANESVDLKLGLYLSNVMDFDDDSYIVNVKGWISMMWNDVRLAFPKSAEAAQTRIPASSIWTPDVKIFNSVDKPTEFVDVNAVVMKDGTVIYVPPLVFSFPCAKAGSGENSYNCSARLGSWTYDGNMLDLVAQPLDVSELTQNPELPISKPTSHKQVNFFPCCKEPYPTVTFSFLLEDES